MERHFGTTEEISGGEDRGGCRPCPSGCGVISSSIGIWLLLVLLPIIILYFLIWLLWMRNGKDVLFVSSDSPIWHEYMSSEILPLARERAVVLNWSDRKNWPKWSLAVQVFKTFSGEHDFNPRPFRRAKSFRFFPAFKEWKHGQTERLEQLRSNLIRAL
jgi:hypothetical protein